MVDLYCYMLQVIYAGSTSLNTSNGMVNSYW